jgi:hypothetical protein
MRAVRFSGFRLEHGSASVLRIVALVALACSLALPVWADTPPSPPLKVVANWMPSGEAIEWVPPMSAPAYYNIYGADASGDLTWLESSTSSHATLTLQFPAYAVTAVSASGVESAPTESALLIVGNCLTFDPSSIPPVYFGFGPCETGAPLPIVYVNLPPGLVGL